MKKQYYYLANVRGYNLLTTYGVDFIVKTNTAKKAIDIVYKQVRAEQPPTELKASGRKPFYKEDITVHRIDGLDYDKNGLVDTFAIF